MKPQFPGRHPVLKGNNLYSTVWSWDCGLRVMNNLSACVIEVCVRSSKIVLHKLFSKNCDMREINQTSPLIWMQLAVFVEIIGEHLWYLRWNWKSQASWCKLLVPELGRQWQAAFCEFHVIQGYIVRHYFKTIQLRRNWERSWVFWLMPEIPEPQNLGDWGMRFAMSLRPTWTT